MKQTIFQFLLSCSLFSQISAAGDGGDGGIKVVYQYQGVEVDNTWIQVGDHTNWGTLIKDIHEYADSNRICRSNSMFRFQCYQAPDLQITDDDTMSRLVSEDINIYPGEEVTTIYVTVPVAILDPRTAGTIHYPSILWVAPQRGLGWEHPLSMELFNLRDPRDLNATLQLGGEFQLNRAIFEIEFFYTMQHQGSLEIGICYPGYSRCWLPDFIKVTPNSITVGWTQIQLAEPLDRSKENHIYLRSEGDVLQLAVNGRNYPQQAGRVANMHGPSSARQMQVTYTEISDTEPPFSALPIISRFSIRQTGDIVTTAPPTNSPTPPTTAPPTNSPTPPPTSYTPSDMVI